jgi:4-alpha-glucanotransferase
LFKRASGVLLHLTSLPGRFGTGDMGAEACRFADFLQTSGQHLWQMLPLGPTGRDNSPYQCLSVFAGNELLISPEKLAQDNLLESSGLESAPAFPGDSLDYDAVARFKMALFQQSFRRFQRKATSNQYSRFQAFRRENSSWLDDYSLFRALKGAHGSAGWNQWEEDIRQRQPEALQRWRSQLENEISFYSYLQFQFFRQWAEFKSCCHGRGISLVGDIPIFVALDSAEVWSHQELFYLDSNGQPSAVAGVPPDYFSGTGQLWGNPLYRWDVMAEDGYAWWLGRFRAMLQLADITKIDHFRGFEKYWEIPGEATTAVNGRWVPGPGAALFEAAQQKLGILPLIAEDLGLITPEVEVLRDSLGFPGMRVLQFAFGDDCDSNIHRPHNYPPNCVAYTGTHDNNTTVGWFSQDDSEATTLSREERDRERQRALNYLGTDGHEINWDFIRLALMSPANTAIIPLQDVLGLGSPARMNTPGRPEGNWRWRFTADMLTDQVAGRLRELTERGGR